MTPLMQAKKAATHDTRGSVLSAKEMKAPVADVAVVAATVTPAPNRWMIASSMVFTSGKFAAH